MGWGLTRLADEEKKPHAPRKVYQERHGISSIPQEVDDAEKSAVEPALEPARLDVGSGQQRVLRRVVRLGGATDEGRRQPPGQSDEQEAGHVINRRWLRRWWWCHG